MAKKSDSGTSKKTPGKAASKKKTTRASASTSTGKKSAGKKTKPREKTASKGAKTKASATVEKGRTISKEANEQAKEARDIMDTARQVAAEPEASLKATDHRDGFIVGIGASAGGLEVLNEFFDNMSVDSGLSFVVVQHLSPDYQSMMVELLSKHTNMMVKHPEDGEEVEPDTVYLIPPKKNLTIFHRKLLLTDQVRHAHGLNLPIDVFLRSLAHDQGSKAVGIILSGTGTDGTMGVRAIKESGGMIMAQDSGTARFDGMPKNAIQTGLVDYILPVAAMPAELLRFVKHPLASRSRGGEKPQTYEDTLSKVLATIRSITGMDFSEYKPSTVIRRIERRMSINHVDDMVDYLKLMSKNVSEVNLLYTEILIGVTRFFRDQDAFDSIKKKVIPELVERTDKQTPIRVWVAGCSTGEEAYTLAIMLNEYLEQNRITREVKIFATDIDKRAIEIASAGSYPASIVADVPVGLLGKYFFKQDDNYQIIERVRKMVIFAQHNLLKDPPFNRTDLITCRNLLIYLRSDLQRRILGMFAFSLKTEGVMFLGASESVGELQSLFTSLDNKWKIYRYMGGAQYKDMHPFQIDHLRRPKRPQFSAVKETVQQPESKVIDLATEKLLTEMVPPSVLINDSMEVQGVLRDAGNYLRMPIGELSNSLLKMVPSNVALVLSTAMHNAIKSQKRAVYSDIVYERGEERETVKVVIDPFFDTRSKNTLYIVSFVEQEQDKADKPGTSAKSDFDYDESRDLRISELEQELQYTRENLQATIEELETSNEELQATNEELMSANEELQSTNEELQSVNEEVYTVNAEYQNKIEELTALNNDMNNFLTSTRIATLFLDRGLHIRKFTPPITDFIPLMDRDLGRPIHHFSTDINYPDLIHDIESVLLELRPKQVEIRMRNGVWYQMRILPYRTMDNTIDGVVVTFVDITKLKQSEELLTKSLHRYESLIHAMGQIVYEFKVFEDKVVWSGKYTQILGYSRNEMGSNGDSRWQYVHRDDLNRVKKSFREAEAKQKLFTCEYRLKKKEGGYVWVHERGVLEFHEDGELINTISVIEDISTEKSARQALEESEADHRRLIENMNDLVAEFDTIDVTFKYANPQYEKALGYTPGELLGTKAEDLMHPEDIPTARKRFEKMLKSGGESREEWRFRHKNGQYIWFECTAALYDREPEDVRLIVISRNVTDKKRTEEVLRRKRDLVSTVLSTTDSLVIVLDKDARIIRFNRACEEVSGFAFEEVYGKQFWELLIPPEEREGVEVTFKELAAGKSPSSYVNYWMTRDGGRKLIAWRNSILLDQDGNVEQIVGAGLDITELEAAQEQVKLLTETVENSQDAIMITDVGGRIEYVNLRFTEITGYNRDEVLGKTPGILQSGKHPKKFYKQLWDTISGGETWRGEFINKRKDGSLYNERALISPVKIHSDRITHFIAMKERIED